MKKTLSRNQKTVLRMARNTAIAAIGLPPRLTMSWRSLLRHDLLTDSGEMTEAGRLALKQGWYRSEGSPSEALMESQIAFLRKAWGLDRDGVIRRALTMAVSDVNEKGVGSGTIRE